MWAYIVRLGPGPGPGIGPCPVCSVRHSLCLVHASDLVFVVRFIKPRKCVLCWKGHNSRVISSKYGKHKNNQWIPFLTRFAIPDAVHCAFCARPRRWWNESVLQFVLNILHAYGSKMNSFAPTVPHQLACTLHLSHSPCAFLSRMFVFLFRCRRKISFNLKYKYYSCDANDSVFGCCAICLVSC